MSEEAENCCITRSYHMRECGDVPPPVARQALEIESFGKVSQYAPSSMTRVVYSDSYSGSCSHTIHTATCPTSVEYLLGRAMAPS